jgi:hypothetical protein
MCDGDPEKKLIRLSVLPLSQDFESEEVMLMGSERVSEKFLQRGVSGKCF